MLLRRWVSSGDGSGGSSSEQLQLLMGGLAGDMVTPRLLLGDGTRAVHDVAIRSSANDFVPALPALVVRALEVYNTTATSAASGAADTTPNHTVTVTMLAVQLPLLEGQPSPPTVDFAIRVHDLLRDEHGIEVRIGGGPGVLRRGLKNLPCVSSHCILRPLRLSKSVLPPIWPYPGPTAAAIQVQYLLLAHIQVPVACAEGRLWVRISAQIYNRPEEYERLAAAVEGMRAIVHRP